MKKKDTEKSLKEQAMMLYHVYGTSGGALFMTFYIFKEPCNRNNLSYALRSLTCTLKAFPSSIYEPAVLNEKQKQALNTLRKHNSYIDMLFSPDGIISKISLSNTINLLRHDLMYNTSHLGALL